MFTTLLRGPKGLIGSAALVALSLGTPALAQEQLSITTGGTGGVYYPMGGGLAEIINGHVDGYSATAEVTGASVENMGLIATGDADFAIGLADTVAQAHSGTGRFDGQQLSMVRGVASLYANMVHIVALEGSGITALEDLRGKRVSIGAPGSGTEVNTSAILEANGITYDDIEEQRLNFNETADALANGDICVAFGWSGDILQARDRAAEAENGVEIEYYAPSEGALMWFDNMAIPVDAPNPDAAHKFLNFIMDAQNMAAASNYVYYANGNLASQEFLEEDVIGDTAIYPDAATLENLYTTSPYGPKAQRLVTRMWTKIKSGT